jgi:hypothetical protein
VYCAPDTQIRELAVVVHVRCVGAEPDQILVHGPTMVRSTGFYPGQDADDLLAVPSSGACAG